MTRERARALMATGRETVKSIYEGVKDPALTAKLEALVKLSALYTQALQEQEVGNLTYAERMRVARSLWRGVRILVVRKANFP